VNADPARQIRHGWAPAPLPREPALMLLAPQAVACWMCPWRSRRTRKSLQLARYQRPSLLQQRASVSPASDPAGAGGGRFQTSFHE